MQTVQVAALLSCNLCFQPSALEAKTQTQLPWQLSTVSYCGGAALAFPDVCSGAADPIEQCLSGRARHGSNHSMAVCLGSANCLLNVLNKLGGKCAGKLGERS